MTPVLPGLLVGAGGAALVAGFLGSGHCAGMCGPLFAAAGPRRADGVSWQAGRLAAYTGLGALAGAVGGVRVLSSPVGPALALAALAWFAADLAGMPMPSVLPPSLRAAVTRLPARLLRGSGPGARFLFGAATALLPCGLLWSGLAIAATTGTAAGGLAAMAAFFFGTLPAVGLAGAVSRWMGGARPWTRRAVAVGVLALGTWSISLRAGWWSEIPSDGPVCHTPGGSDVP